MTPQDLIKITGQHQLFLGIETHAWSLDQFRQAAQFARAHNVDTLLVKVADGTNEWYNGKFSEIRQTILNEGVGCIPYMYSYGRKFNALAVECNIMQVYLAAYGIFCMDAEAEWNGDTVAAEYVCRRVQGQGTFMVSTWADPSLQNWGDVIRALAPCTNVFMPQEYNSYLSGFWTEFAADGATWLQPTINLTQDFGANDPVAIARNAYNQQHTAISVWYYDTAVANPGLLDAVYAAFPKGGNTPMSGVPQGWSDNDQILTAPNGVQVVQGFRDHILNSEWDPANVPQTLEYGANPVLLHGPEFGGGTRQLFLKSFLWWTQEKGVIEESLLGWELNSAYQLIMSQQAQITALQSQLNATGLAQDVTAMFKIWDKLKTDVGLL